MFLLLAVLGSTAPLPVMAQTVPVEAFAKASPFSMPRLSPDGQYLAFATDFGEGNHALQVVRLSDMHRTAVLRLPRYESPYQIIWVGDRRLVVAKGRRYGSLEKPIPTGEIIASDFDGENQRYIYGYEQQNAAAGLDRGFGFIEGIGQGNDGRFYMRQLKRSPTNSMLYLVDAGLRPSFKLVASVNVPNLEFVIDRNGVARYAWGRDDQDNYQLFASGDGQHWQPIAQEQVGGMWTPMAFSGDNQRVYGRFSRADGPSALVLSNPDGGQREVLVEDGFGSIGLSQWTRTPATPFAAAPLAGRPQLRYFDPGRPEAELHKALADLLPQQHVTFDDVSRDGQTVLVHLASDRDPGSWYTFRRGTNKLEKVLSPREGIDPTQMAERRPVRFKASDGLELEAVFTVPKNAQGPLPTVILPHGGPHGVRDDWFYDTDAQFLANRGYLVVQVNYRGSGGRGQAFEERGYLQWGTRVQQDLVEGLREAEKQGLADTSRVCSYGASFGAYSAMMLAAREPQLIRCAVGLAGLYDLKMMYKKGDIKDSAYGRNYLGRVIGRSDEELVANSPTGVAARITVPVFLAHGERDERTPIAQANAMRSALTAAGRPPQWMAVAGEGHGFYNDNNSIAFYRALETFLQENIGQ
ncbi:prolyl oligopeptidase family serine peptidase [Stenotrophomonas sp.]|uniref:prolyl oligopeptidase family serine peptidase n=1 Tax=Stenotrophomonas sp. TaxID=69392 RepID=UPI0028A597C5|nr:prolyl oligopeptidase family serine peptidase [Stenotrophomonas sp.]